MTTAQATRTRGRPTFFLWIPVPVATLGHTAFPCGSGTVGRDYLWQSVHAQDTHTLLCVHYSLDSGEGIHKQLVQREGRINLAGYAP